MRILHVFASFATGGLEMRAAQLMGMMRRDVQNTVIALDGRTDTLARIPEGVRVQVVDPPGGGGLIGRLRAIRRVLRGVEPDLVLTHNWGTIEWVLAGQLAGRRALVHHEDGFGPDEAERLFRRRIWARRMLLGRVEAVVVPSAVLAGIARERWRVPESSLHHLPNGVDLDRFRPRPPRSGDAPVFGCVGRLSGEKDQALAVRAFARADCRRRARLVLVGDGPELEKVRALARDLDVPVEFRGAVDDTAPCYAEMDVFLMSSRTEQMPLSLLEAMASALPVVATDVGDVAAMLSADNRPFVVAERTERGLAAAMDCLAGDPDLRARLGAANRARAESEYECGVCYRRYLGVYERAVGAEGSLLSWPAG